MTSERMARAREGGRPLLQAEHLRKYFAVRSGFLSRAAGFVHAVDDVSFEIMEGETLGIVGESGCGKSTTGRLLMHLVRPDEGTLSFRGTAISGKDGASLKRLRKQIQMVFQDSSGSLNPRLTIASTIAYGPRVHGMRTSDANASAERLLSEVGLPPAIFAKRYPHELSGGQRQRVNIARALALDPLLVILDEALAALDKSIAAQVVNLLVRLRTERNLTYVFISHDLEMVEFISDRILVMYLGKVVEAGSASVLYAEPRHPYTRALLASRLSLDPDHRTQSAPIGGDPPSPIHPPKGCRFRPRCAFAEAVCSLREPILGAVDGGYHVVACHMFEPGSGHSGAVRYREPAGSLVREGVGCAGPLASSLQT